MRWSALLDDEYAVRQQLEQDLKPSTHTLFDEFSPNPGGQTRFFDYAPLTSIEPMEARYLAALGGIGSGKSYCGAAWASSRAILDPKARGMITAGDFGQLSRATLVTLAEVCQKFDIPLDPCRATVEDTAMAIANRRYCYLGKDRAFVYVLSMNLFAGSSQTARGLQIRWVWADEPAYVSEQAFQTLDGRLGRGPGTMKGQGLLTTSPNGFNWVYDRFADPRRNEDLQRLYVMFSMKTRENIAALGEDYVAGLEANYTDELAAQELEGEFINTVSGRAYKYFDRQKHALADDDAEILEYDPLLDLHVSFDFNYSPACCVLAQQRGNEIHFFQEFYCMDSDTWELSALVTEAIDKGKHQAEIYIYGDASGSARTAVSRQSNWDIVFAAFKDIGYHTGEYGRLHRKFDKANPPVKNRINSCNCLFKADRVYVDLDSCPELVKDWEVVGLAKQGDKADLDKSDPLRTHPSDAAGYLMHRLFPYKNAAIDLRQGRRPVRGIAS